MRKTKKEKKNKSKMHKNSTINECDIFKLATTTTTTTAATTTATTNSKMSLCKSNNEKEATQRACGQKNQSQRQTTSSASTTATATAAAATKSTRRCCTLLNAGQLIKQLILLITSVVLTMFFNNNNNYNYNTLRIRSCTRTKKNGTHNNNSVFSSEQQQAATQQHKFSRISSSNSNSRNEHERDKKKLCLCTFLIIKVFVLIIMIMILATTRVVVHGQQITQQQQSAGGGGSDDVQVLLSEISEKHYNNKSNSNSNKIVDNIGSSLSASSSEEVDVEEKSISTRLGVDLIKSNNMFNTTTAEVVVKENDQEAQQQQKILQEVKSSAKLNTHAHTHTRTHKGTSTADRDRDDDADADADSDFDGDAPLTPPPSSGEVRHSSSLIASIPASGGTSSSFTSSSSAARHIINLMSRDNVVLKRQLREKAKHDSLESIKMHILMRLKLTKLPNITTPIPVPQNILENFYKSYNATRANSTWRRGGGGSGSIQKSPTISYKSDSPLKTKHTQQPFEISSADTSTNFDKEQLQSDDPYAYPISQNNKPIYSDGYTDDSDDDEKEFYSALHDDDDSENIMSHINSIYIFPETTRIRHNRRSDLLHFKLDSNADVSRATMHLYIRGLDWIKEHEPNLLSDIVERQIVVAIHKAVRRPNATNYTHKLKVLESRHKVPTGAGQWVKINVLPLVANWMERRNESHEILIQGTEAWMRPLIVTSDSTAKSPLTVHIEIGAQTKHRYKRSISLDCKENDHEDRCCRYPLEVNFRTFGWNFVIAPTSFNAYFCNGECKVGYLEHYTHTHLTSLTASATPCCSPTKMSALDLLYFDDKNQLVMSVIPNMSVEKCSCS